MAEYAIPRSGKERAEFSRRRSVINQVRAAKIRERRAARKAGNHGRDAEILMEGQRAGIPYGGVAHGENLDQLVLSEMAMERQLKDRGRSNRATQREAYLNYIKGKEVKEEKDTQPPKPPREEDEPPTTDWEDGRAGSQVSHSPQDTFFGWMANRHPDETSRFIEDLMV